MKHIIEKIRYFLVKTSKKRENVTLYLCYLQAVFQCYSNFWKIFMVGVWNFHSFYFSGYKETKIHNYFLSLPPNFWWLHLKYMDNCLICKAITAINWWWFAAATIVSFAVGAVWYSWVFWDTRKSCGVTHKF